MKDCKGIRHLLLDYLEGTLTKDKEEMVRNHLYNCEDCRTHFEMLSVTAKRTEDMLSSYAETVEPPPYLWGNILKEVQKSKGKVAVSWWKVAVATCAAIGVLMTGTLAPVFGAEGNLLNVISGSIIENASSDLNGIITDDLLGSLRKEEILTQIIESSDLTEELVWELEEKGYSEKDIVQCAQIADSGSWPIERVIEHRDKGYGFGRIANWSGVSVFSVQNRVAKPIHTLKNDISKKEEFEVKTTIAGFDEEQRLISPHLPEPIRLPPEIIDGTGMQIPQGEIEDSFVAVVFKFENGKPVAKQIIKQKLRPPKHFNIRGEIESIENGIIKLNLLNGETVLATLVNRRTKIFGEIEVGSDIEIFGYKSRDGRIFVDFIKPAPENMNYLPPRVPFETPTPNIIPPPPPPPQNDQSTIDKPKPENKNPEDKTENTESPEISKPEETTIIIKENQDTPTQEPETDPKPQTYKNKAVKISSVSNDAISTNFGTFDIKNATVELSFKGKSYPISKEVLSSTNEIEGIRISGEGASVDHIVITEKSLTKTECLLIEKSPNSANFKLYFAGGDIKIIKSNSFTIFESGKRKIMRGSKINLYRFADIPDLAVAIEVVHLSPENQKKGRTEGIDSQGIIVDGKKYAIVPTVSQFFKIIQGKAIHIEPFEIASGSEVELTFVKIEDSLVATRISLLKPGKREPKPGNVFTINKLEFDDSKSALTLSLSKEHKKTARRIVVTNDTAIEIEQQPGKPPKVVSMKQLLRMNPVGKDIVLEEDDGKILKITVISHPVQFPF